MQRELGGAVRAALAFAGGVAVAIGGARAQSPRPTLPPAGNGVRIVSGAGQANPVPTLADVMDNVNWDPLVRGTLLIVSPEETVAAPVGRSEGETTYLTTVPPLEADTSGGYRINQVAEHFDRRLVPLHSLTVLAPTTMTVLNYAHLPRPNAYAGMSPVEKTRLLLSNLTPEQWRIIAGPDGIGAGDLRRDQRDLFLSILPDPFVVTSQTYNPDANGAVRFNSATSPTTLTSEQREMVHLSLNKTISWTHIGQTGGDVGIGIGNASPGTTYHVSQPQNIYGEHKDAFGTVLSETVPNRSKPSQLPYDYGGYDVSVPVEGVKTVGDLVRAIAAKTRAELYCDPRYAERNVFLRGTTAQAGDLLHALAWAVTGTWRRLGDAFVLTDDLIGLGVRHAIVGNWLQENELLAQMRERDIDKTLADRHGSDYLSWSASDPNKPDDSLAKKMADYDNETATQSGPRNLTVPTSELPTATQAMIQKEADFWNNQENNGPNSFAHQALRSDAVHLQEKVEVAYVIPGIGNAAAPEIAGGRFGNSLLNKPAFPTIRRAPASGAKGGSDADAQPATLPASLKVRAAMIAPATAAEVEAAAREAKKHGFNELWVQVTGDPLDLIRAAVRAGAANGLAVRPIVRLLRAEASDSPARLDTNILAETGAAHAAWWRTQLKSLGVPDTSSLDDAARGFSRYGTYGAAWADCSAVDSFVRKGDYRQCDDPEVQTEIAERLAKIASIPGIGGIIVRDTAAPGYDLDGLSGFGSGIGADPLLKLGYTDRMRLGFLKKSGLDPIDLSPVNGGDRFNIFRGMNGGTITIELPFFRDLGANSANSTFNGQRGDTMGAKDAPAKWDAYRAAADADFLGHVIDAVKARNPSLSIILRHGDGPLGEDGGYFGSVEKPTAVPAPPSITTQTVPAPVVPLPPARAASGRVVRQQGRIYSPEEMARAVAKTVYYAVVFPSGSADMAAAKSRLQARLAYDLKTAATWDGAVFDLSALPVQDALDALSMFTPAASANSAAPPAP